MRRYLWFHNGFVLINSRSGESRTIHVALGQDVIAETFPWLAQPKSTDPARRRQEQRPGLD
ncbi:MAG: hypothetical protein HOV87_06950 [Catenulispora sp.]|nr:hypothetical protein [Catenulispora sp.]